ncbi:MAG: beta-ketoacyl-ACP synthase II [Candidatus Nanopelagicales bacterium]|jgi:3-oxoacyl-[acyl-carrier-protein] synthase II|nr:beta-ketoacyl-ACP synthase II [Candidatus Nanopelagicales bacterium]
MSRRVVVTGLGAITPIGKNVSETWANALAGKSGVVKINQPWSNDLAAQIAGLITIDPYDVLDRVSARRMDRSTQLGVIAVKEAWADAGSPDIDKERLGVYFGTGIGGLTTVLEQYDILNTRGPDRVNPLTVPMIMPNSAAAMVGLEVGARAGVHSPVSACATSAEAIAGALEMIRNNRADIVVAGGTEACVNRLAIAAFASMRALSTRNDEPQLASRPYDTDRDGFVMGEGAGALILEEEQHALKRGAKIYGVVSGAGMSSDGYHIAAPEPEGAGAARAIKSALLDANAKATDVCHINAHATSTPVGDIAEYKAMRSALGDALDNVVVTATKSMTGHLLGGAGAVESVFTIMGLKEGVIPPTINLNNQDPEINVRVVTKEPFKLPNGANFALNNSFGFGGHNVCIAFSKN